MGRLYRHAYFIFPIGLVAFACASEIPPAPQNLSITPQWGPQGEDTPVEIRGDFEVVRTEIDYPSATASSWIRAFIGDEELELNLLGDGTLAATVPASLDAGDYPLIIIDGRGREGRLEEGFRILSPTEEISHFEFSDIASAEIDLPFSLTLSAVGLDGEVVSRFVGSVDAIDLTGSLSPLTLGPFVEGVWTGDLTIALARDDNMITVSLEDISSQSLPFDVQCAGGCPCLVFYADNDGDGFGDENEEMHACALSEGYAEQAGDCDDEAEFVFPGATEIITDGIDQDCDGFDVCYADGDGDGFGDSVGDGTTVTDNDLDCGNASNGETDLAGDCNDSDGNIKPGADEIPADGIDQDCSGGDLCYEDVDGDGYGVATLVEDNDLDCTNQSAGEAAVLGDCDEVIPTCNVDCTTNTDGDSPVVTDCMELYCGSDPASIASSCINLDSTSTLQDFEDAIAAANASASKDWILVNFSPILTSTLTISSGNGAGVEIRVAADQEIIISGLGQGLIIEDDDSYIERIRIENATIAATISGSNNTFQDFQINGFADEGIHIAGANNVIMQGVIQGCAGPSTSGRAGIVVDSLGGAVRPDGNTIADNLIVNNDCAAMQLRESPEFTTIDHNTIAYNALGIEFLSAGSGVADTCMRNNNFSHNTGAALEFDKLPADVSTAFDTTATCTGALSTGPEYGNNDFGNGAACSGSVCVDCVCLPAGTFWSSLVDPVYTLIDDATAQTAFCPTASELIDTAANLSYDLNGAADGEFSGVAADVGAREAGADGCPTP